MFVHVGVQKDGVHACVCMHEHECVHQGNPHLRMGLQLCPSAFIKERRMNERNGAPFLLTLPTACVLAVPRERHFVLEL